MDSRKKLEQHLVLLSSLKRGGIRKGFGSAAQDADHQLGLARQWETQERLVRRVLSEPGDPRDRLLDFRERTQGFVDKYPEREGWTDPKGDTWNAQSVLEAIDKLVEEIDLLDSEDEFYGEDDEEMEAL